MATLVIREDWAEWKAARWAKAENWWNVRDVIWEGKKKKKKKKADGRRRRQGCRIDKSGPFVYYSLNLKTIWT